MRHGFRTLAVLLLVAVPQLALACPVCGQAGDEAQQWAFLSSTIFLSLAPLLAIGAGGGWIWWQLSHGASGQP